MKTLERAEHELHCDGNEDECEANARELTSTPDHPYHYVNSGLDNVYLVGIKYLVCDKCKLQSAQIPALNHLLAAIARAIVAKPFALTGAQVRFLRKRLSRSSKDFAAMVSLVPTRYSELENGKDPISPDRDKLVRLVYKILSGDRQFRPHLLKPEKLEEWITSIQGAGASERIIATWKNHQWKVESTSEAA